MRVHLAIIFSLVCGPAMADDAVTITSTRVNQDKVQVVSPVSIGRPHTCSEMYPAAAIAAHAQGTTTMSFTIKTDGTVRDIRISKSSGNKDLDDATVKCAAQWLYKPAMQDGVTVEKPWQANVVWKIPVSMDVRRAEQCLRYRSDPSPIPPGVGATSVTFRIMPNGSMKDAAVSRSSGDKSLDTAAILCVDESHFDVSIITLPPEGVPGHATLDWAHATPSPMPSPSPK